MDICKLIVYVQKAEEERIRDREEYRSKKSKIGNDLGSRKVV